MDSQEILTRVDANYFRSWSLLTAGTPGHEIVEQDGLIITSGAHNYAAFNLAYLVKSRRPVEERLEEIRAYFARKDRPYMLRFRVGAHRGLEKLLAGAGFVRAEEPDVPAMVHSDPGQWTAPEGPLDIITCRTKSDLTTWATTVAKGYGIPEGLSRLFTVPVTTGIVGYELYLGYASGEPVATSGLVLNHGVAGVYVVATLPGHRRKGYGEMMTRQAMVRGREAGACLSGLQSSAMGMPVYRRMGFRHVGRYRSYVPKHVVL